MVNYKHLHKIIAHAIKKNFYTYETIYVHINQKNKIKLEKNRLDKNNFVSSTNTIATGADYGEVQFVSADASITNKNKIINTNIRLKGNRSIHYKNIKNSSYKFNIKGQNTFLGLKKFSLQKPRIRNYMHEWIFHELMSEGDLIKLKYDFMYFNLNGQNMGLYVLEEGFGKELLERNKRRNGPIFSVDESYELEKLKESKLEIYDDKTWLKEENINVAKKGIQNLKNFFNGKSNIDEIFDIKKWAWFFAVVDLTYTEHGAIHTNVKFYYNPINGKFEPIPYDGHRRPQNYSKHLFDFDHSTTFDRATKNTKITDEFLSKFFYSDIKKESLNKKFYFEYIKAVKKISSKDFLDKFFASRKKGIEKITSAIYTDSFIFDYDHRRKSGVGLYYFDKNDIYFRASKLLNVFSPKKTSIFIEEDGDKLIIYNKHIHNINLNLTEIVCDTNIDNAIVVNKIALNSSLKFPKHTLDKKDFLINDSNCNFLSFGDSDNNKFHKKVDKINGNYQLSDIKIDNYKKYFKQVNSDLFLKEESVIISENILIPENYKVIIKGGEKIILRDNAFIFSKSPWKIGSKSEKVFIGGQKDNFGGGILITDTEHTSSIYNTDFSYLAGLRKSNFNNSSINTTTSYNENGINQYFENISTVNNNPTNFENEFVILGSVNFYEADVEINEVKFERISSEDAINIFRSNFKINNFTSNENLSDAIDIDFSFGEIKTAYFKDIGNDAIDLSGSNVNINNISLNNVGDKLISVGEKSTVNIIDIKASQSYIGIVSKDGSNTKASKINFNNVKIPFSAYKKKSEYDFGKLSLSQILVEKDYVKWIKDEGSIITMDGVDVGAESENIIPIIYRKNLKLLEKVNASEG